MQKSVMDIWTTLVQLGKCNTSHASQRKESIALSVFRRSKVPLSAQGVRLGSDSQSWLWVQVSVSPLSRSTSAAAGSCHQHREAVPASVQLRILSARAARQPCAGTQMQEKGKAGTGSHAGHLWL